MLSNIVQVRTRNRESVIPLRAQAGEDDFLILRQSPFARRGHVGIVGHRLDLRGQGGLAPMLEISAKFRVVHIEMLS